MHDIEPFYKWREEYTSATDRNSPFYGREYSEFHFTNKVYNYLLHPQWDEFGSATLYLKILFADYEEGFAIIELIGEWNDAVGNDIMFLKRDVADELQESGITHFILICENVLNFHGSDDCYYEEWFEDLNEERGWVALINVLDHVGEEMKDSGLDAYVHLAPPLNAVNWRTQKPKLLYRAIDAMIGEQTKTLGDY
jgi:hypothetical protein